MAIKKYIATNYKVDPVKHGHFIKKALANGVEKKKLIQVKGVGASGSFKLAKVELGPKKKKVTDAQRIDDEARNATGHYLPKKGGTQARHNAFKSNLFNVIDHVKSSQTGAGSEYLGGFKPKNVSQLSGSRAGLLTWDETNYNQPATAHSRKRSENHNAF